MKRAWDIQKTWNPWLSVGIHFDHTDPSITLHLPGAIVVFGNCKQPGFRKMAKGVKACPVCGDGMIDDGDGWCCDAAACETNKEDD